MPKTHEPPVNGRVFTDPITRIEWRDGGTLNANHYNPNVVFDAELALIERSILRTGWVQPILINPRGIIIDGFHRYSLSRNSPKLLAKYGGMVPVVVMDVSDAEAMFLTIRMNRAKGTHVAFKMHTVVRELIDVHGCDRAQVALEIGATLEEIDLLYQEGVFTAKNIQTWEYSKAWVPKETGRR
jgi:hypothetical protein